MRLQEIDWKLGPDGSPSFALPRPLARGVPLDRREGRAATFEEQVFSFALPTVEMAGSVGAVGACLDAEDVLFVATNDAFNSLRVYVLASPYRSFDVLDLPLPHFNFRGAPRQREGGPLTRFATQASLCRRCGGPARPA